MRRSSIIPATTLVLLFLAGSPPVGAESAELKTRDLKDNVKMRITGARISHARGQNLMVRLVPVEGGDPVVVDFPSHSFTPHETTIMAIVRSVAVWPKGRSDYEWSEVAAQAILSVPKDAKGRTNHFEPWYLVSLKLPKSAKSDDE